MIKHRVRIWNSELASRVESGLPTLLDRRIFRQLLAQNEICETELQSLLWLWHTRANDETLCGFLIDNGLLLVETRSAKGSNQTESDLEQTEYIVSLTSQAQVELRNAANSRYLLARVFKAFRNAFLSETFEPEKSALKLPVPGTARQ